MADLFSADLGALERDAAVSEEGSASETDEEEFPLSGFKLPRFTSPPDVSDHTMLLAALTKQGAATLAAPVVKPKTAALAHRACAMLRDEAQLTYMFANPNSTKASPGACEAIHVDDGVLSLLRAADRMAYTALRQVLDASEQAARSTLSELGHPEICALGLPMATVGEGALSERWHNGREGCPSGTNASRVLLSVVVTLDKAENESLRSLPRAALSSSSPARGKRPRGNSGGAAGGGVQTLAYRFSPKAGQVTLVAPEAYRAVDLAPGSTTLTTWWQAATPQQQQQPAATLPSSNATTHDLGSASVLRTAPLVFDGALDEASRAALAATRPIRWALYDRGVGAAKPSPRNAQERAIESLLAALGDSSRYVEYWGRARWDSVPAHFDCDEGGLINRNALRRPDAAHVLYLDIPENVHAPTVLWRPSSGDVTSSGGVTGMDAKKGDLSRNGGEDRDGMPCQGALFTVPAVGGRLLRFCGEWVHGVPRPAREYLGEADEDEEPAAGDGDRGASKEEGEEGEGSDEEESNESEGEEEGEEEKEEAEGEEDCEEEGEEEGVEEGEEDEGEEEDAPEVRLHVLLFNCWIDAPPTTDGKSDEGIAARTGEHGVYEDAVQATCAPFSEWRRRKLEPFRGAAKGAALDFKGKGSVEDANGVGGASTALVARLMGTPRRRGCAMRYRVDDVAASREAVRAALMHNDTPQCFILR